MFPIRYIKRYIRTFKPRAVVLMQRRGIVIEIGRI